ncbi:MFS transporter [Marisediminicola sp. LYQ85]|uniref:MFS transporter n=1 Tax=Marisediminicola sp. LYQ85 TaxID=3391062 RepID=UPI00398319D7
MRTPRPLPVWAGRTAVLVGIVLVALNLRTAVAAISPIVADIRADIAIDSVGLGLIGALPPVAFAISGLVGGSLARRVGLERLLVLCILAMALGHVARGLAPSYGGLLAGSVVAFAGIGLANILLPPLVKRYFPDRIGLLTTVYVSMMSISTAVSASLAAPLADAAGWRWSLGVWAALAVAALVPWVAVLASNRGERMSSRNAGTASDADTSTSAAPGTDIPVAPTGRLAGPVWRSRTAWAVSAVFALSSLNAYAAFSWLPQILTDVSGVTPLEAGALLAVYGLVGLPAAILLPPLVVRARSVTPLVFAGIACFIGGYAGLLLAPTAVPLLWVVLAGAGPLLFPVAIVLINLRSRTAAGSVAMSGFVQGVGYTVGALGPLAVGLLHDATGSWTVPLLVLIATAVACIVPAIALGRVAFVEDEVERR